MTSGTDKEAKGKTDQLKGRATEAWGDLTGDESTKAKGQREQAKGKVKEGTGHVQNAVNDLTDTDQ